ncbi:hypothetical protein EST38_g8368 [Candolleomyces aberdarensis]|uniref:Uncharacterized protein n=1 Tax=Candolleomyces aberdarensis TaxID=2316362 RepID=A0A4Q2DG49_9AGAR|nr:hypothetical protein EST38_g8368 [Candolleomyces aberdarensis]
MSNSTGLQATIRSLYYFEAYLRFSDPSSSAYAMLGVPGSTAIQRWEFQTPSPSSSMFSVMNLEYNTYVTGAPSGLDPVPLTSGSSPQFWYSGTFYDGSQAVCYDPDCLYLWSPLDNTVQFKLEPYFNNRIGIISIISFSYITQRILGTYYYSYWSTPRRRGIEIMRSLWKVEMRLHSIRSLVSFLIQSDSRSTSQQLSPGKHRRDKDDIYRDHRSGKHLW